MTSSRPHPEGEPCISITMCKISFFSRIQKFLLFTGRGSFSRALGCGARRAPACTPRCKCGSRPGSMARALGVQSREIWQVTTGIAFRGCRAEQANGKLTYQLFYSTERRQNNTRFKFSPFLQRRTLQCVCGHCLCVCVLCMCYVCAGVRVCAFVWWNPTFYLFLFLVLLCLLMLAANAVRAMAVSHRPSSSQALYFVAATAQQQSRIKFSLS